MRLIRPSIQPIGKRLMLSSYCVTSLLTCFEIGSEKIRLPAMYPISEFVESGGLMSYGANNDAQYRRSASFVARILKGAKPADLPLETPTKFEFAVNLK